MTHINEKENSRKKAPKKSKSILMGKYLICLASRSPFQKAARQYAICVHKEI